MPHALRIDCLTRGKVDVDQRGHLPVQSVCLGQSPEVDRTSRKIILACKPSRHHSGVEKFFGRCHQRDVCRRPKTPRQQGTSNQVRMAAAGKQDPHHGFG